MGVKSYVWHVYDASFAVPSKLLWKTGDTPMEDRET